MFMVMSHLLLASFRSLGRPVCSCCACLTDCFCTDCQQTPQRQGRRVSTPSRPRPRLLLSSPRPYCPCSACRRPYCCRDCKRSWALSRCTWSQSETAPALQDDQCSSCNWEQRAWRARGGPWEAGFWPLIACTEGPGDTWWIPDGIFPPGWAAERCRPQPAWRGWRPSSQWVERCSSSPY